MAYRVNVATVRGRHMLAHKALRSGDLVLREAPCAALPFEEACDGCFAGLGGASSSCTACGLVSWCSEACRVVSLHPTAECEAFIAGLSTFGG